MDELRSIEVAALQLDPVLPPIALDDAKPHGNDGPCEPVDTSFPLIARPGPAGAWYVIVDPWRWAALQRSRQETALILVRQLDDAGALRLAYTEEARAPRKRSPLERAWLVAALVNAERGVQSELAIRAGYSSGMFSHYKTVGETITPEFLRRAGIPLEAANGISITELIRIAALPSDEAARALREAVESKGRANARPAFEFSTFKRGVGWKASARGPVETWTRKDRRSLLDSLGPLVDVARALEGESSPEAIRLRQEHELAHTQAKTAASEIANLRVKLAEAMRALARLEELNAQLHRELQAVRPRRLRPVARYSQAIHRVVRRVRRFLASISSPRRSMIEGGSSTIERPQAGAASRTDTEAASRRDSVRRCRLSGNRVAQGYLRRSTP
jgi:hypothetical protein